MPSRSAPARAAPDFTPAAASLRSSRHALGLACAGVALSLLAGCAVPEPWVKPYERERLADPMMQFSRDALPAKHREHVRDVREGARGATGVQGGGCGCN